MEISCCSKLSRIARKPIFGVSDTNLAFQPQKIAGSRLKISDLGSRGIVLCTENKGADQLRRSHCAADLRLRFLVCKKAGFLIMRLLYFSTWPGPAWSPALSLSSILISIQSLMNEKPYHNEPGFEEVRKIVINSKGCDMILL